MAVCIQEEIFGPTETRCTIMDSNVVREKVLELRDNSNINTRQILQGIGKSVMGRSSYHIDIGSEKEISSRESNTDYVGDFLTNSNTRHSTLIETINDKNSVVFRKLTAWRKE